MPPSQEHFDFEALLANLPDAENELLSAVDTLEERNERELALQMLELAIKRCPSAILRKQLAERYLHRRNYTRAQELLVEQVLEDPDDAAGLLLLARAYSGLGQIERARDNLQRAHACGIAQDRILFWADKLNIPAERKPVQAPKKPFNDVPPAIEHAGDSEPTHVSPFSPPDSLRPSRLDSAGKIKRATDLRYQPAAPTDETSVQFGLVPGELDFDAIADPDDETGIHFGLISGDDNGVETATPTDETSVHFGLLPGELDFDEIAEPNDETGIHFGLMPGENHAIETAAPTDETSVHFLRSPDELGFDAIDESEEETGIHFGMLSDDDHTDQTAQTNQQAELRVSGPHEVIDFSELTEIDDSKIQKPISRPGAKPIPSIIPEASPPNGFNPSGTLPPAPDASPALELDNQPYVDERSSIASDTPTPQSSGRGTRMLRNLTHMKLGAPKSHVIRNTVIVIIAVIICCVAAVAVVSNQEIERLDNLQAKATTATQADTYTDYLKALALLQQANQPPVYLGGLISHDWFNKVTLPGLDPDQARPSIQANLALVSALIEYRFESSGTRNAASLLAASTAPDVAPGTEHTVAEIYLALTTRQFRQAQTLINNTSKNYLLDEPLRAAVGHALLDADPPTHEPVIQAFVDTLTSLPQPTNHDRLLLAKMHVRLNNKDAAIEQLETLETSDQNHVSARLEHVKIYREKDAARARSVLNAIIDSPKNQIIAPYEKAQAYNMLGQLLTDDPDKAEDSFKQAVAAMPRRASVYQPLLELYLSTFRFDDARALLAQAQAANETSEHLVLVRAELLLNAGLASQSLQMLDDRMTTKFPPVEKPAQFHWLRGLSLLQSGDPTRAMEAFQLAAKDKTTRVSSNATTAAAAFALYAGALSDDSNISAAQTAIHKLSENIREQNIDAANIYRADGLIQMLMANQQSKRSRATSLARAARKSFEKALELRKDDSTLLFDICQADIFLNARSNKSCEEALAVNNQYLPGMLAIAQHEMLRGEFDKPHEILQDLRTRHPFHPQITLMLARVFVERKDFEQASVELNSLLGKPEQKSLEWDILEGRIALSKSEHTRALGYFERAHKYPAKSSEQEAEITLYLAQTLTMLGHTERAEQLMPTGDGARK